MIWTDMKRVCSKSTGRIWFENCVYLKTFASSLPQEDQNAVSSNWVDFSRRVIIELHHVVVKQILRSAALIWRFKFESVQIISYKCEHIAIYMYSSDFLKFSPRGSTATRKICHSKTLLPCLTVVQLFSKMLQKNWGNVRDAHAL